MTIAVDAFKRCPRCGVTYPRDPEHFKYRTTAGKRYPAWCWPCQNDYLQQYADRPEVRDRRNRLRRVARAAALERDPEPIRARAREYNRRRYEKIMATPEGRAAVNEAKRMASRGRAFDAGKPKRLIQRRDTADPYRASLTANERLDPAPFKQFIRDTFPDGTPNVIATALTVNPRTLWSLLNDERTWVSLLFVDQALTNIGRPDLLNDLYPPKDAR